MSLFSARNTKSSGTNSSQPASSSFLGVQAKLNIGKSDDKYEREADRMADKVVNKTGGLGTAPFIPPSPKLQKKGDDEQEVQKQEETEQIQEKTLLNEITPLVQRKEEEVQEKGEENEIQQKQEEEQVQAQSAPAEELQQKSEEEDVQTSVEEESIQQKGETEIQPKLDGDRMAERNIQRKEEEVQEKEEEVQEKEEEESLQKKSAGNGEDTSNLEQKLSSSKGGGNPMDSNTRNQMESGFGTDFSGVRIHNDANAVQMNKELGAQAFTNGNDIYFNEGKYDPSSKNGQHLLAHELTHTVQQGASNQPNVQKAAAAPVPADAPALKPTVPLDITHRLNITGEWAKYLDAEYEKKKGPIDVDVKIGERYSGTIELSRKKGTDEGELAKYEITNGTKKKFLKINGWSFLQPLRDAGIEPVLVLNKFGEEQVTTGFLSVAIKDIAVGNAKGFIDSLNENLDKMGFLGVSPITIADGFVNEFSAGRLVFQVGAMKTLVDGYLEAGGGMGITGDVFTFNVNASIDVAGLASGEFMIARGEDGSFSGTADIEADIANVNAKLHVEYIDGTVTIQGTGRIQSEKFSGEITLLVTDAERSKQMMHAALGVEAMDAEKEQAEAPAAPVPKSKGNQVLAGWGEITANITPWLSGTAKVGIDAEGHVTIVGEITVPQEVELMEQRGKKVDIFKVEIRAGYGIPLVGQVFLFASIGMFMNAGFGPLVLKGVGFKGTYSTDPNVLQEFEITGTLNINAFAVLGLEAEAGVGVTILGHDIKAGVNVTAAAGLRAYAEATPTLQYKEQAAPQGGKMGETRLKGHFEAAAQLFMQLSGSLFYELDSPWWSPAPDGREDFPLGEVQYPIGDSMGIGADMDWLVGSSEIPELKFSPVEFDADKFTADVMADPPPRKMGKADEEKAGEWEDGNKPGNQQETPETKDGAGLPDTGKAKEDLKKLPDEQKYMRALDEMSKLEKADPKPTFAVVKAKADKVKAKYGLDQIKATDKGDIGEVFVKHAKQDNKKHLLEIPMMSAAERYKLLKTAMDDLKMRNSKAGGEEGTVTESEAKELIAAWQKAHPVVEETHVVDGGATWDYFIDIGDKSETEKGKKKKVAAEENMPVEDGKIPEVTGISEKVNVDGTHHLKVEGKEEKIDLRVHSDPIYLSKLIEQKQEELDKNPSDPDHKEKTLALQAIINEYGIFKTNVSEYNLATFNAYKKDIGGVTPIQEAYKKIMLNVDKIAEKLEILGIEKFEFDLPKSNVTYETDSKGRAYIVKGSPISKTPGNTHGAPATKNPKGYEKIGAADSNNWVRAHMLNHQLHGPNETWNLFPGTKEMNTTHMLNKVEKFAKDIVLNNNGVIYYYVYVSYGNTGEYEDFPTVVHMTYGNFDLKTFKPDNSGHLFDDSFTQSPPTDGPQKVTLSSSSSGALRKAAEGNDKNLDGTGMSGFFGKLTSHRPDSGFNDMREVYQLLNRIYKDDNIFMSNLKKLNELVKAGVITVK